MASAIRSATVLNAGSHAAEPPKPGRSGRNTSNSSRSRSANGAQLPASASNEWNSQMGDPVPRRSNRTSATVSSIQASHFPRSYDDFIMLR